MISLSKASTKSLSYPVLSNFFGSDSEISDADLFYTEGIQQCKYAIMVMLLMGFHNKTTSF